MSNRNDNEQGRVPDLEALSRAYEQSLKDVSFGGKSVPVPKTKKRTEPTGELKDFVPTDMHRIKESSAEHDRVVDKIKRDRKRFSHSVWTDEPVLKPKKSIWIDDSTQQYDKAEFNAALKETRQSAQQKQSAPAPARRQQTQQRSQQQQQRPTHQKKSEPLILAMAEPEQPSRESARRNAPQQRRPEQQPIRSILDEKPKKQEFVIRMGQNGASRVQQVPRQPNKKQVMMQMSRETFEQYEKNGINSDNSVRKTVNISMPLSKMIPDEPEVKAPEKKVEVKAETKLEAKPKPKTPVNAKAVVDGIAEEIVGKKSVKIVDDIAEEIIGKKSVPAEESGKNDIAAMSLDEIIRETKAAAELEKKAAEEAKKAEEEAKAKAAEEARKAEEEAKAKAAEEARKAEEEAKAKTAEEAEKAEEKTHERLTVEKSDIPVGYELKEVIDDINDSFYEKTEELNRAEKEKAAAESLRITGTEPEVSPEAAENTAAEPAETIAETESGDEESYDFTGLINKVKTQKAKAPQVERSTASQVTVLPESERVQDFERAAPKRAQAKKNVKRRKKPKYHESEFSFINSIMCIGLVFTIFISLLLMKRESGFISSENRNLATFPKFSGEDYVSGKYTKDITEYFTDTIPGRETFKKFGAVFGKNLGINLDDTVVTGNHKVAEKEEVDKEKLATTTTVTVNTDITEVTSAADTKKDDGKGTTSTTTTTAKKSTVSEEVVELPDDLDDGAWEGDVIVFGKGKEVRAVAGYYGLFGTGALYAETINKWKEELPNVNVYNMSIPNASAYYLPDSFKDTVSSQKDNIDNIASELRGIINVDVYDTLDKHKKEYIYSRTDHHWQPLGAYYAGKVFAEKASIDYPDIKFYEEYKIEGFLGTMYAYSNYDPQLAENPDTFIYYKPDNDYTVRYYDTDFTGGIDSTLFFDNAEGVNCYSAILGRDEEITEIETDRDNHRVLVIFKDSYGNALVPFLTHGFEKIYVCDFRYFDCNAIDFCKRVGCTDLLFAVSLQSCSTEMHISAINNDRIQLDPSVAATSETTTLYNFDKPDESGAESSESEDDEGKITTTTQPYGANDNAEVFDDPNAYNYGY